MLQGTLQFNDDSYFLLKTAGAATLLIIFEYKMHTRML